MLFENVVKDRGLLETAEKALQRTLPMARLQITELPGLDQIRLALLDPACSTGPLPEEVMRAVIAEPAYWSFCWGSGLALAKWLLEEPDSLRPNCGRHRHRLRRGSHSGQTRWRASGLGL